MIAIGEVGFRFIKKFNGIFFSGIVTQIITSDMQVCKFNDGKLHQYSLQHFEKYSKLQSTGQYFDDDDDNDFNLYVDFPGNNSSSLEGNDNDSLDAINVIDIDNDVVCIVVYMIHFSL